jgi:hypothetical protein
MQRFLRLSLAVAAALLLVAHSPSARSAESKNTEATACGSSAREAIAAGKKALRSQSREDEHAAIVCLIEALSSVEARLEALEDRKSEALVAPKGAWRNQR